MGSEDAIRYAEAKEAEAEIRRLGKRIAKLERHKARLDDIREVLAMDFTRENIGTDDEVMVLRVSKSVWNALIDNMNPMSDKDIADHKCWPRSAAMEFRDNDNERRIAELEAELNGANIKAEMLLKRCEVLEKLARNPATECYVCSDSANDCGCQPNVHNRAVDEALMEGE